MLEHKDHANLVSYVATGASLLTALKMVNVDGRDVIDDLISDAGFARAMLVARGEREDRFRREALDVGQE